MGGMTSLLLERPGTFLDYATRESVEPEQLRWSGLYSDGTCTWREAHELLSLIGEVDAFTFLTFHRGREADKTQRFFQCTGGGPSVGGRLLAEIGSENDVAVVAPWDAGWGRQVPVTAAEPWSYSEANELALLRRDELIPIAYDWIIHGELSSKYRLRPVPTFSMPALNR